MLCDVGYAVDTLGIAFECGKAIAKACHRIGEGDCLAALWADVHAGADNVEAARVEAGDERVELDDLRLHRLDTVWRERRQDNVGNRADQPSVGLDIAVGLLVCDADADLARALDAIQRRFRPRYSRHESDRGCRKPDAEQFSARHAMWRDDHDSTPLLASW